MAEKRENSVLFSLMELRSIEDDRVKKEEQDEQARIAADRRAKEEAARLAREEAERKIRDEQDRIARLEHEKERQIREEQMRLEEASRRAQIEAQARLEEARIHAEASANAGMKKPPIGAIVGGVGAVVLLAGGALLYVLLVYLPNQRAADAARFQAEQERAVKLAIQKVQDDLNREFEDKLKLAKDDATRKQLLAEKATRERQQEDAIRARVRAARPSGPAAKAKSNTALSDKCKGSDDPLCGAGL